MGGLAPSTPSTPWPTLLPPTMINGCCPKPNEVKEGPTPAPSCPDQDLLNLTLLSCLHFAHVQASWSPTFKSTLLPRATLPTSTPFAAAQLLTSKASTFVPYASPIPAPAPKLYLALSSSPFQAKYDSAGLTWTQPNGGLGWLLRLVFYSPHMLTLGSLHLDSSTSQRSTEVRNCEPVNMAALSSFLVLSIPLPLHT